MLERRNSGSVNWLAITGKGLSTDQLNELIQKEKLKVLPPDNNYMAPTRFCDYYNKDGNFAYLINGENVLNFYYIQKTEQKKGKRLLGYVYEPIKYSVKLNYDDNSEATGLQAFNYINTKFKEIYGISIRVAFGYSPECLSCIPAPINYGEISPDIYKNFYKIDVSSAYATEASKTLPTMKDSKNFVGVVKPNADYPFAFYPKEGKLAVYGEGKYLNDIPITAEYTILCKACEYSLAPIFKELYESKESTTDPQQRQYYKDILNYFVGMLHWRPKNKKTGHYAEPGDAEYNPNCPRYAIIAAIVKARCNARMLELKDKIENYHGNEVKLINTDAIGWTGHDMPELYTTTKALGNLILEHKNAEALILGSKKYQIKDKDGTIITKWSGIKKEITKDMKWQDIRKNALKPKKRIWDWDKQQVIYTEDF